TLNSDYGSCTKKDSAIVVVRNPTQYYLSSDLYFCEGENVELNANPNQLPIDGFTFNWSNGENTPSIQISEEGEYSVIIDNEACGKIYDTIQAYKTPLAEITVQPENQELCVNGDANFEVQATGKNLSYQWEISKDEGSTWSDI